MSQLSIFLRVEDFPVVARQLSQVWFQSQKVVLDFQPKEELTIPLSIGRLVNLVTTSVKLSPHLALNSNAEFNSNAGTRKSSA